MFFSRFVRRFKWESIEQYQGYLGFVKWAGEHRLSPKVRPSDLFFIQKDHESDVYWRELVGDQVKRLEDQIHLLQLEIRELKKGKKK